MAKLYSLNNIFHTFEYVDSGISASSFFFQLNLIVPIGLTGFDFMIFWFFLRIIYSAWSLLNFFNALCCKI